MLTHLLGRPSTPDDIEDYHTRLAANAHSVTVYPGIRETLEAMHPRMPLAVFSGASIRACRILLEAAGLLAHFDALVGADEVARSKPEPDGIELACRRLDVPVREAAYVGDAPNDLEAARRSGALAIGAVWGAFIALLSLQTRSSIDPEISFGSCALGNAATPIDSQSNLTNTPPARHPRT